MIAFRLLLFGAMFAVASIAGSSQAIQPTRSFRLYPAGSGIHIQSISQGDDTVWALARDYRRRTNDVIRISWNGAVYPVDFNLSGDYVSICANPGGGYWLTKLDGTLEEWDEDGLKKRQWQTPANATHQVRAGRYIVSVNPDSLLLTDVESGRGRAVSFPEGWQGGNISAFDRLRGNEIAAYSGTQGAFLKLDTDFASPEAITFTAEALDAGRAMYRKQEQAARANFHPGGTTAQASSAVLLPGIAADGNGKVFAIATPLKKAAANILQFTADGVQERAYALDLRAALGQDAMLPVRLLARGRSLMLISGNGLAQVFELPR
ncbi:MAG: hypothetical protein IT170_08450 [Bryobacterales bacterium]|nr:hypothetical protein [Bryobacterales bacterium]